MADFVRAVAGNRYLFGAAYGARGKAVEPVSDRAGMVPGVAARRRVGYDVRGKTGARPSK